MLPKGTRDRDRDREKKRERKREREIGHIAIFNSHNKNNVAHQNLNSGSRRTNGLYSSDKVLGSANTSVSGSERGASETAA